MSLLTGKDLRETVKSVLADETLPLVDIAEGWLHWFKKRGDRCIRDAAKLGYSEITMDLPIEIAQSMDRPSLAIIQRSIRGMLEGCLVGFVEDEYKGSPICRLYISWEE